MNAADILKYGHSTLMHELDLTTDWDTPGAAGEWSVKDIFAHMTAYEHFIAEVLQGFVADAPKDIPYMTIIGQLGNEGFNTTTVGALRDKSHDEIMQEYSTTHDHVMQLIAQIPAEKLRENGTIPWYGNEYSLDDFIVYTQYGHKREHAAQIALFRTRQVPS